MKLRLTKAWTAINRLSIIWKSDLTDKMKRYFFQAAVASILLYGCTTWTLAIRLEKKLDGNCTRMLRAILNKSWRQHPTRHQLYGHRPPITKTIQVRRTRHAGHYRRSRDELISDVLLWTPTYGRAKAGRPARTYIQQLCEDTGCSPEDLPEAMNDREKWREKDRDIRATSTTWWWWWWNCTSEIGHWKNSCICFYQINLKRTRIWKKFKKIREEKIKFKKKKKGLEIIIVIIIIIKSRWQHGFPRFFLSIHPYHPSLPTGLPNDILCPHCADVSKFMLVEQYWHFHV